MGWGGIGNWKARKNMWSAVYLKVSKRPVFLVVFKFSFEDEKHSKTKPAR